ncbi:MAG: CPBP family glutamic-type intramembrane protease [Actinomycetota bacterium]|nr:CPBP family glutamic-type intramembrane protease [Actinomycetota bacterium]
MPSPSAFVDSALTSLQRLPRSSFTLPAVALAMLAWLSTGELHRAFALAVLADAGLFFLPWKLPRRTWSAGKFWLESLLYLLLGSVMLALALATGAPWVAGLGHPLWLAAAVVTGCLLAYGSGIDVRALLSGDLVELAGPDRPGYALARATHATLGAIAEESLFRGAVLALHALAPATIGATILAFVARHRLLKGVPRWSARTLAVEIVGAALFTGLALASGSVVPAIAAHLTANAPYITLQMQRARLGRSRRPDRAAQRENAHRSD